MIDFDRVAVRVDADAGAMRGTDGQRTLLQDLTLSLPERRIAIIGANGSGKSTLLKLINGLVLPSSGSVTSAGLDTRQRGRDVRRRVGFIFTDPLSQLVMPTGREDVELSLRSRIKRPEERRSAAQAVLERFGIADLADRSIYDLSGGERQLLAIAVVAAVEPLILVADEPTTLLDLRNEHRIRDTLRDVAAQLIFTTHNLSFALDSDRCLVIDSGRIAFDGPPVDAVAFYRSLCAA
ncbi:biotin transport system ATP-binding protein [Arthrobacter sp. CAN_A6]|uniref:energy-coupling factor ABC transporter ATP-binding protein n=1 Tax=Arthrobacter sp. CAN_A6 TaxID=2787721 RepID=UPI0018C9A069